LRLLTNEITESAGSGVEGASYHAYIQTWGSWLVRCCHVIVDALRMPHTIMVVIVQGFDGPSSLAKEGIDQEQKNTDHAYFVSSVRHLDPLVACLLL